MAILDLGCGWGSASLFLAEKFPNALVVGVSNSHGQRGWILEQARQRNLSILGVQEPSYPVSSSRVHEDFVLCGFNHARNLRIVTCDVSQVPLVDAALPVLKKERPEAEGFDRVVSIEMMENLVLKEYVQLRAFLRGSQ